MIDTINQSLTDYQTKWDALIAKRKDPAFFKALHPTAVGWKVADRAEYDSLCVQLHDQADKIVETWMNGRWIAKIHLKDSKLSNGTEIIKIMQRRPGSTDTLGLDHVDFYTLEFAGAEQTLKLESEL